MFIIFITNSGFVISTCATCHLTDGLTRMPPVSRLAGPARPLCSLCLQTAPSFLLPVMSRSIASAGECLIRVSDSLRRERVQHKVQRTDASEIRKPTVQRTKGVDKKVAAYEARMDDEPIDGFGNIRPVIFSRVTGHGCRLNLRPRPRRGTRRRRHRRRRVDTYLYPSG